MTSQAINLMDKLGLIDEQWQPRVVAEMNEYQKDTDETFLMLDGRLRIDFRDGAVRLSPGEMLVVPKGLEHKPNAEHEVTLLLIEPRGVRNTGGEGGDRTAPHDVWV